MTTVLSRSPTRAVESPRRRACLDRGVGPSELAVQDLLTNLVKYLRAGIWTANDPWLKHRDDQLSTEARSRSSPALPRWRTEGCSTRGSPAVYNDEVTFLFQSTM